MPNKHYPIVTVKNKSSMIVYLIVIITIELTLSLILLFYYYNFLVKITAVVTSTTSTSTSNITTTSTIPTDCLNNPFSKSCIDYCKKQSDKNKCMENICNNKYNTSSPYTTQLLNDCINPARMSFNDLQYVFKTAYYCKNTGIAPFNNPSANITSSDCLLAAGAFLDKKVNVINSLCNEKYKDVYQAAYDCQLETNYQKYHTINTLINCSDLSKSSDNIITCFYYIQRSLAYENKNKPEDYNNRVNEICSLVNCDSPINFNLPTTTINIATGTNITKMGIETSKSIITPRSLLLNENNRFQILIPLLSGFCVEAKYPIPPFLDISMNYNFNTGRIYGYFMQGYIPTSSDCAVLCPYNGSTTMGFPYGGDSCSKLIQSYNGVYPNLREDLAEVVNRCGSTNINNIPDSCRVGKGAIKTHAMCHIKYEACNGKCSNEYKTLPACCATYSTSTSYQTIKVVYSSSSNEVKLYKLETIRNNDDKPLIGTEEFLNTLAKTISDMRLANYKPSTGQCPTSTLPSGCQFTSSYRSGPTSSTSAHGEGLAVDICCNNSSTIRQLARDFFDKGKWPGYIISEVTSREQECNKTNTNNCPYLIHLEYPGGNLPRIKPSTTPCYLINCDFNKCASTSTAI